jgi:hypothetical protein
MPSHVAAAVAVPLLQDGCVHIVELEAWAQALPSCVQWPSLPHGVVPTMQALAQQIVALVSLSSVSHWPLVHSAPVAHVAPLAFVAQMPAWQLMVMQSASPLHFSPVAQRVPPDAGAPSGAGPPSGAPPGS